MNILLLSLVAPPGAESITEYTHLYSEKSALFFAIALLEPLC